MQVKI